MGQWCNVPGIRETDQRVTASPRAEVGAPPYRQDLNGTVQRMYEAFECEQVVVGLTEYLEGALPPRIEREFDRHLRACTGCQRDLRQIQWTIDHLAAMPKESIPPGTKITLLQALHCRRSA